MTPPAAHDEAQVKVIAKREARSWASSSVSRVRTDKTEPAERLLWEAPR